jgi:hypothetical protein
VPGFARNGQSSDLLSLNTKDIAHPTAAELVGTQFKRGSISCQEFMGGLDSGDGTAFYQPIKKNRVDFFAQEPTSEETSQERLIKR